MYLKSYSLQRQLLILMFTLHNFQMSGRCRFGGEKGIGNTGQKTTYQKQQTKAWMKILIFLLRYYSYWIFFSNKLKIMHLNKNIEHILGGTWGQREGSNWKMVQLYFQISIEAQNTFKKRNAHWSLTFVDNIILNIKLMWINTKLT